MSGVISTGSGTRPAHSRTPCRSRDGLERERERAAGQDVVAHELQHRLIDALELLRRVADDRSDAERQDVDGGLVGELRQFSGAARGDDVDRASTVSGAVKVARFSSPLTLPPPETIDSTPGPQPPGASNTVRSVIDSPTYTECTTGAILNSVLQFGPPKPGSQTQVTRTPSVTHTPWPLHMV